MAAMESESIHVDEGMETNANETSKEDEQQPNVLTLESILFLTIYIKPKILTKRCLSPARACSFTFAFLVYKNHRVTLPVHHRFEPTAGVIIN